MPCLDLFSRLVRCPGMRCHTDPRLGYFAMRGFTLLELMVVMVIITITTAFAIPSLRNALFSDQLKATARRLIGLVAEAGQESVRNQSGYLLKIDLERNRVWMEAETREEAKADTLKQRRISVPDSVRIMDVVSLYGGKRSQGTTGIRFTKKGYVDKTFIHLQDDDGRSMTIMLSPFLGVTRVVDTYVELGDQQAFLDK